MSVLDTPGPCDVAIIGGGAAGVLTAIGLLRGARSALRILILEPSLPLARGVAYATPYDEHLLNVPAGKMGGFPDQVEDFLDYLIHTQAFPGVARDTLAASFVPRWRYAEYLRACLQQAVDSSAAQLEIRAERVLELDRDGDGLRLVLASGQAVQARRVVLASGNALRPLPARGAGSLPEGKRVEAWDFAAVRGIAEHADVAIIGSGLSMADTVVSLLASGHRGRIHVLSRHALMPLPHAKGPAADYDPEPLLAMNLRQRLHALRGHARAAAARGIPWQNVMERIRPMGQALWQTLSCDDQRRFLRHVVRYWDIHRHRIAGSVHAQLVQLQQEKRLVLHRGRLETAVSEGACVRLTAMDLRRHPLPLDVHCVVNATGVEMRAQAMRNPLLQQLLGSGLARPGPHGMGIDSAPDGSLIDADGVVEPRVQVLGSLRIGRLWESLAIPELRGQAAQAAVALG
ncbi:FAD/NAD(P)-binding protein [Stenotrophomonas sp. STM01]|uniref:FAD/NAD(P)-binding protein n=1 Tax=Stenotrophomonas sp. STM01 TaxID=2769278 RepID=UPI00178697E4|nr:FAD/NAD(P)-binding protein [Stenotrophomonas sp. STM01]MBD9536020.1 FAD/NAD(P)-binding protein [Stenotrophomonas sp. STM01]